MGAQLFDDGDDAVDPFEDAYLGDIQCRKATMTSADVSAKEDSYVIGDTVPMSGDKAPFYYMDSQYTTCDDIGGVMTGWSVHVDDSNVLTTKSLCNVNTVQRNKKTVTRRTAFAPQKAGMLPHKIDCGLQPLVGIGFETKNNGDMVRCRYDCAQDVEVSEPANVQRFYTGWTRGGDSSAGEDIRTTLSGQTLQCPKGTVLTAVSAASCDADKTRTLVYKCNPIDLEASKKRYNSRRGRTADSVNGRSYWVDDLMEDQQTVFDKLGRAIHPVTNATKHVYNHIDRAVKTTAAVFDGSQRTLQKVGDKADSAMTKAGDIVGKDAGKAVKFVGKGFRAIGTAGEKLRDATADAGYGTVKFVGKDVVRPVTKGISSVGKGISGAINSVAKAFPGDRIKDSMSRVGGTLAKDTSCVVARPATNVGNFVMSSIRKSHEAVKKVKQIFRL